MMDTTAGGGASAAGVDSLVRAPQVLFGLTVVMITHKMAVRNCAATWVCTKDDTSMPMPVMATA